MVISALFVLLLIVPAGFIVLLLLNLSVLKLSFSVYNRGVDLGAYFC